MSLGGTRICETGTGMAERIHWMLTTPQLVIKINNINEQNDILRYISVPSSHSPDLISDPHFRYALSYAHALSESQDILLGIMISARIVAMTIT